MKVLSSLFTLLVLGGSLHNANYGCNPSQHCVVESSWGSVCQSGGASVESCSPISVTCGQLSDLDCSLVTINMLM